MSSSVTMAALALANFLMAARPGGAPYRAVALLLGRKGHERAGASVAIARVLHARSSKMIAKLNARARSDGLTYDPFEIVEFNSFDQLLAKRPRGGGTWQDIMLVTHGSGVQPEGFTGGIFFGPRLYAVNGSGINDLLDAINARPKVVTRFRAQFDDDGTLAIIACGVGTTGPDVAHYVRELFGVEGRVRFPIKDVDFFQDGSLGTPVDPEAIPPWALRPLRDDEWRELPSKDVALDTRNPIRP